MIARALVSVVVAASFAAAGQAYGLGADLGKKDLAAISPHAVHGFFVNWSDVVFFKGDAATFNEYVAEIAKKQDAKPTVIYHEGTLQARSPWDKSTDDRPADWKTLSNDQNKTVTQIDVWLGGRIEKEKIQLPKGVEGKTEEKETK